MASVKRPIIMTCPTGIPGQANTSQTGKLDSHLCTTQMITSTTSNYRA